MKWRRLFQTPRHVDRVSHSIFASGARPRMSAFVCGVLWCVEWLPGSAHDARHGHRRSEARELRTANKLRGDSSYPGV
jgi:hypothetical protein